MAFGDLRLKKESPYMPFFGGLVQNQVLVMQPPTLKASFQHAHCVIHTCTRVALF